MTDSRSTSPRPPASQTPASLRRADDDDLDFVGPGSSGVPDAGLIAARFKRIPALVNPCPPASQTPASLRPRLGERPEEHGHRSSGVPDAGLIAARRGRPPPPRTRRPPASQTPASLRRDRVSVAERKVTRVLRRPRRRPHCGEAALADPTIAAASSGVPDAGLIAAGSAPGTAAARTCPPASQTPASLRRVAPRG